MISLPGDVSRAVSHVPSHAGSSSGRHGLIGSPGAAVSSSARPSGERLLPREGEEDLEDPLFGGISAQHVGFYQPPVQLAPGQQMNAEYEEMKAFIDYSDDPEQLERMKIDARNAARAGMTPDQIQDSINEEEKMDLMMVLL